ncbi:HPr family phosphocarrier protein [Mycoplasmopsis hyopharyngis]|uniref:HPr family phosphocarrier protein n=1 Tax=Mycoplasmopsis hyopharyngis TaxID=29558 RepID=UPI003872B5F2
MKEIIAIVADPMGLHARPVSILSSVASKYESEIKLSSNGRDANLKSVMNVMSLGVKKGHEISIKAIGPDELDAINEIKETLRANELI